MTEPMKPKVEQLIEVAKVAGDLAAKGADAAVVPRAIGIGGAVGGNACGFLCPAAARSDKFADGGKEDRMHEIERRPHG